MNKYLNEIHTPSDVKKLSCEELEILANEVREKLISEVSKTGGHLASNLGTIELTIALHKVFDCPKDEFVWEVGHQSYTHKMLTGRLDKFNTLRQKGGISGFPKHKESEYDAFVAGHASTSVSAAYGIAQAKKISGDDGYSIAIVGDGSFTGGLIYEGLNNSGKSDTRLIVILNDNEMSISKSVGGLARYFSKIRNKKSYFVFTLILVALMWSFQFVTVIGVKEDRTELKTQQHTSLKGMVEALVKNDQLMVTAVAMALFMIGYCTTTSFGVYYFKYAYKNEGTYMVFAAVLGVAQLTALSIFPQFSKKYTRKQLYTGAMVAVVVAYILFFFSFEKLPIIIAAGLILFFAQAFIQLLMLLFLADAVEYGQWKLGKRNESVSFAVQPFINKLGGAVGTGVVTATLIISGINPVSQRITEIEQSIEVMTDPAAISVAQAEITSLINGVVGTPLWIMKTAMMLLPLVCIVVGFVIYNKKFIIDEKMYAKIVEDLKTFEK
ncbi:MAG: MFS transporter [Oscillospiraceae bacterium]|nr:MFS transporter [Oscillospiraceae bacterium]